jgi:hypothetical protein
LVESLQVCYLIPVFQLTAMVVSNMINWLLCWCQIWLSHMNIATLKCGYLICVSQPPCEIG